MKDRLKVIQYNLNIIIKRIEKLKYEKTDYEIEKQLELINNNIYAIGDAVETIEILIDDNQINISSKSLI